MNKKLVLIEATVYDNITEANGRQEVLTALREQAARIAELEAEIINLKTIIAKDDKYIEALESDLRDGTELVTKAVTE